MSQAGPTSPGDPKREGISHLGLLLKEEGIPGHIEHPSPGKTSPITGFENQVWEFPLWLSSNEPNKLVSMRTQVQSLAPTQWGKDPSLL